MANNIQTTNIIGIIIYHQCPCDKANQGVVPNCNPKNLPSKIAGTLLIASRKAKNKGNWINASRQLEKGLKLYLSNRKYIRDIRNISTI